MACRDPKSFDAYIRERLAVSTTLGPPRAPKSEAARVVLDFAEKDRVPMGEAVLLAIEALPQSKTKHLRRIVDLFEPYCEWIETWLERGRSVDYPMRGYIDLVSPNKGLAKGLPPKYDIVCAAAGVDELNYIGTNNDGDSRYRIIRT